MSGRQFNRKHRFNSSSWMVSEQFIETEFLLESVMKSQGNVNNDFGGGATCYHHTDTKGGKRAVLTRHGWPSSSTEILKWFV